MHTVASSLLAGSRGVSAYWLHYAYILPPGKNAMTTMLYSCTTSKRRNRRQGTKSLPARHMGGMGEKDCPHTSLFLEGENTVLGYYPPPMSAKSWPGGGGRAARGMARASVTGGYCAYY